MVILLSVYRTTIHSSTTIYNNYDATYHALLTIQALDENEARVHRWFPIITLGDKLSKNARWGDTRPDTYGNYYYFSFPTLGFIIPYVALTSFNFDLSIQNLANFNFVVGLLAVLLLFSLIRKLSVACFSIQSYLPAGLSAIAYMTSTEFLFSHGYNYWGHSISQIFFICFLSNLYDAITEKTKKSYLLMALFGFLMAATEWTGYICLLVSMLYFFPQAVRLNKSSCKAFFLLGAAGVAALILFLTPMVVLINDYAEIYRYLFWHAAARSFENPNSFIKLLYGYYLSFGYIVGIFPLALGVFIFSCPAIKKDNSAAKVLPYAILFIIAALIVVIENTLMKEHATTYTYDRLKLIIPIAMLIPYVWASQTRVRHVLKAILVILVLLSAAINIKEYPSRSDKITKNTDIGANDLFVKGVNLEKSIIGVASHPSSYVAILFHKNFHNFSGYSASMILDVANKNNATEATMINATGMTPGFVRITSLDVYNITKKIMNKYTLAACDKKSKFIKELAGLFQCQYDLRDLKEGAAFNLTNEDWKKGIATSKAGFLVMGYEGFYRVGSQVEFSNQEKRTVTDIILDPPFLQVLVDGLPLDSDTAGWPHSIRVVQ